MVIHGRRAPSARKSGSGSVRLRLQQQDTSSTISLQQTPFWIVSSPASGNTSCRVKSSSAPDVMLSPSPYQREYLVTHTAVASCVSVACRAEQVVCGKSPTASPKITRQGPRISSRGGDVDLQRSQTIASSTSENFVYTYFPGASGHRRRCTAGDDRTLTVNSEWDDNCRPDYRVCCICAERAASGKTESMIEFRYSEGTHHCRESRPLYPRFRPRRG